MNYFPLGGGVITDDATATASQILSGYTAYVKGKKITGNIPSQGAQTITPGTSDKTISSGRYLSGTQTIKGDSNLVAGNIKAGTSIFGVSGTFTSDANAGAGDILSGKTAYVNGSKVSGNIRIQESIKNITTDSSNQTNGCFRVSGNILQIIPGIGYWKNWSYTAACLQISNTVLSPVIGLTANKIISGNTIFGIAGTGKSSSGALLYMGIPSSPLSVKGYIFGTNTSITNGIVTINKTEMYRIVLVGYNEENYAAYLKVNNVTKLTISSLSSGSMVHDNIILNVGDKVTISVSGGSNFMVCGFINS